MARKRKIEDLTQAELKERLHYDPDTGIFTRLKSFRTGKIGTVAGGLSNEGYIKIYVFCISYNAHRLAWLYMYGKFPEYVIDHIDGVRTNNKISNLRDVTRQANIHNQKKCHSINKLGFLGVTRCGVKFKAGIMLDSKLIYLGLHDTPELAHEAYLEAKRIHHSTCTI